MFVISSMSALRQSIVSVLIAIGIVGSLTLIVDLEESEFSRGIVSVGDLKPVGISRALTKTSEEFFMDAREIKDEVDELAVKD